MFVRPHNGVARILMSIINKSDLIIDKDLDAVSLSVSIAAQQTQPRCPRGVRQLAVSVFTGRIVVTKIAFLKTSVFAAAAAGLMALAAPASAADVGACLITKTDTNPFFVKMKEGATAKATELGVTLKAYAGKIDGDNESQVAAIESCIADGAKGILLCRPIPRPSWTRSRRRATPAFWSSRSTRRLIRSMPPTATFATDNFKAGELIGAWAAGDARRRRQGRQDRLPRPEPEPADRRRSARPGLHDRLRHRHQGRQQDRRRG